jgi:hypothetical protein
MVAGMPEDTSGTRSHPGRHRAGRGRRADAPHLTVIDTDGPPAPTAPAEPDRAPAPAVIGELIAGRYLLDAAPAGRSVGLAAYDIRLDRPVTLTYLPAAAPPRTGAPGHAGADVIALAAAVDHPALATMLDLADDEPGHRTALVTDRLASVSLAEADLTALPAAVVYAITWQLADALRYLHERGIGHARITADNVQLSRSAATDYQGGRFVRLGLLGLYDLSCGRPARNSASEHPLHQRTGTPTSNRSAAADDVYDLGVLLAHTFGPQRVRTTSSGEACFPVQQASDPSWNAVVASMITPERARRPSAAVVSAAARSRIC